MLPQDTLIQIMDTIILVTVLLINIEFFTQKKLYSSEGLLNWQILKYHRNSYHNSFTRSITSFILKKKIAYFNFLSICVCTLLLSGFINSSLVISLLKASLLIILFLIYFRSPYGQDGADQAIMILLIASLFISAFNKPHITKLILWFLTMQICLSYFTAGYFKLISKDWRNGEHLKGILFTEIYGNVHMALNFNKTTFKILSIVVIGFEVLFPLILIMPNSYVIIFLAIGFTFHIANAFIMGLNTFLLSFSAFYPAVLYCLY